ncbi:hypothetical protein [Acinetobacter bohemicus]|uniref:hypothetical protein n=1 Tax=Acinetobacter bohemicus TaxID=1435036 RepID=UPI00404382DA
MENPNKIEIEGIKTIHKLCKFGADHKMEGCSFTEIVERIFDELAKAQAVPKINGSIQAHELTISEIKAEIEEGYDLCQDVHLLDALVEKGIQIGKILAVPEGFVLIKNDTKTIVAIERMVEQQVEASGMDSRRLERLDGWRIIEAAIEAQEQKG